VRRPGEPWRPSSLTARSTPTLRGSDTAYASRLAKPLDHFYIRFCDRYHLSHQFKRACGLRPRRES
jgi:hypothetical protein